MLSFLMGERLRNPMIKAQVVAILTAKKDEQVAAVSASFDAMIAAVEALDEGSSEEVLLLRAQIVEKDAVIAAQAVKLSEANAIFKQGDALIEDPA
jgi:hypothetical protein